MKKILFILALMLSSMAGSAQELVLQPQQPTTSDLLMMLEDAGYKCLVFDLSPLAGKTYHIDLTLREYVNGQFYQSYSVFDGRTRNDFSDLPEADRQRLLADPKNVEANTAKKLIFNFLPSQPGDRSQQNDSLQYVVIGTEMLKMPRNLKKHGLFMPISGKTVYNYSVSTFMPKNFVTDEFIPLVLYASAYIDKDNHLVSESSTAVPADLQTDFVRRSPHYYVIGVTFKEDTLQK